jgi:hypothetical protein
VIGIFYPSTQLHYRMLILLLILLIFIYFIYFFAWTKLHIDGEARVLNWHRLSRLYSIEGRIVNRLAEIRK